MKITQYDDTYTSRLGSGETTLVSGSSGGSNSGYGGDVVGSAGSLSVVGLRQTVSLSSNLAPSAAIGNVLTLISVGGTPVAQFAVPSNSGGVSAGSNSTRVSASSAAGVSATYSPSDHIHDGIGTVTASSSNTLDRGTLNLRAGTNVALALSDSDGSGGFDTVTISASATGGSSGGSATGKGAGTLVQSTTPATVTNGGTHTLSSAPVSGNLLLAFIGSNQFEATSLTSTNTTWTNVAVANVANGAQAIASVWKGVVSGTGGTVVTVNFGGSNTQVITIHEYSGVSTSNVIGIGAAGAQFGPGDLVTLSTLTPGGRFIAYEWVRGAGTIAITPTTLWTLYSGSPVSLGGGTGILSVAYCDASTTTTYSMSASMTGAANNNSAIVVQIAAP